MKINVVFTLIFLFLFSVQTVFNKSENLIKVITESKVSIPNK